jgi:hypothetical protein
MWDTFLVENRDLAEGHSRFGRNLFVPPGFDIDLKIGMIQNVGLIDGFLPDLHRINQHLPARCVIVGTDRNDGEAKFSLCTATGTLSITPPVNHRR